MNRKIFACIFNIGIINQYVFTNIFATEQDLTNSRERFRGIIKNGVKIEGNEKIKVLLKMKPTSRAREDRVQILSSNSYMSIERLGIYAKYLSYEELLEIEEDIEIIESDEDAYFIKDERTISHKAEISTEIMRKGTTPYGIEMTLQDKYFWKSKIPSGKMKLCIADTGYDLGHEDLPRRPDVTGKNTPNISEKWSYDGHGHGTHVAGTVAAVGANMKGVRGIFSNNMDGKLKLIIAKAFNVTGRTSESKVISAVENCVSKGANVINLSLGSFAYYDTSAEYYQDLYYNKGILIFAAAGNEGNAAYRYPASYPSVISVGALKRNLKHAKFSNSNDQVELMGPGQNIKSTTRRNKYSRMDGSSMATPHISAIAGLIWMHFPNCTNHQIRNVLTETAMDISSSGCKNKTGFGFVQSIDAYNLLSLGDCGQYKSRSKNPGGGCSLDSKKVGKANRNRLRQP